MGWEPFGIRHLTRAARGGSSPRVVADRGSRAIRDDAQPPAPLALTRENRELTTVSRTNAIAHDLNNALTPILGYADLLLDRRAPGDDPERLREYLEVIRQSAAEAARLLRHLGELVDPPEAEAVVALTPTAHTALGVLASADQPKGAHPRSDAVYCGSHGNANVGGLA